MLHQRRIGHEPDGLLNEAAALQRRDLRGRQLQLLDDRFFQHDHVQIGEFRLAELEA